MDIKDIKRVPSTRLSRGTAELLNRVAYGGERFIVTSSGKERAALVSVGDLQRLLRLSQDEEGELQEIVGRWLDQNFESNTWERELVRVSELLGQLGIAFAPPTRWIEDVSG